MPNQKQLEGLKDYIALFNDPAPSDARIKQRVAENIIFSDPIHTIEGQEAFQAYLAFFAARVKDPCFIVRVAAWNESVCLVRWDFNGLTGGQQPWRFSGVSELYFDNSGRVTRHVDYWDAGRHLYGRIPLLRRVLAMVQRHLQRAFEQEKHRR